MPTNDYGLCGMCFNWLLFFIITWPGDVLPATNQPAVPPLQPAVPLLEPPNQGNFEDN